MATAPRNANALDDVNGPEDLDNFVKELMDNMVRILTSLFIGGMLPFTLTISSSKISLNSSPL